jgi:hypothetical protein
VFEQQLDMLAKAIAAVFTSHYMTVGADVRGAKVCPSQPFPEACRLLREIPCEGTSYGKKAWGRTVQIFDFSESRRMASAAEIVTAVSGQPRPSPLLVVSGGDALQYAPVAPRCPYPFVMLLAVAVLARLAPCWLASALIAHGSLAVRLHREPFWPEGLGVNRGVNNVQDSVWAINQWQHVRGNADGQQRVVEERQKLYEAFSLLMSGNNKRVLQGYDPCASQGLREGRPNPIHRPHLTWAGSLVASGGRTACFPGRKGCTNARRSTLAHGTTPRRSSSSR